MQHSVSTVDGKVTADERERLTATHGASRAAEIIAEVEAQFAPAEEKPAKGKSNKAAPPAAAPTSESEE